MFEAGDQQEVQVGTLKYLIGNQCSFKSFFCFSKVDGTCVLVHCGQGSKSSFLFRSTRTTCLQGPLVHKDLLSVRTTCPQGLLVYKDHFSTRTNCPQGPLVHKDLLYTRTSCPQGSLFYEDHLSTKTSCLQGPLVH